MRLNLKTQRKAFVLVFVLWVLAFLTVLIVQIGLTMRQRMTLLKRLEDRQQLTSLADAGVKRAMAVLADDVLLNQFIYTPLAKQARHNNSFDFGRKDLGLGYFRVVYYTFVGQSNILHYGVEDEESKININTAPLPVIRAIVGLTLHYPRDKADRLAKAIVDWRGFGRIETEGFQSEYYYSNLNEPYPLKNSFFERLDELMLVDGVTSDIYHKLKKFVTIYGTGEVNINTASTPVLKSLGLSEDTIAKIFLVRRGKDGQESTEDDYIFQRTYDIATEINDQATLTPEEVEELDFLNRFNMLTTNSFYYRINSEAYLNHSKESKTIECVFNTLENRLEYWYEK